MRENELDLVGLGRFFALVGNRFSVSFWAPCLGRQ